MEKFLHDDQAIQTTQTVTKLNDIDQEAINRSTVIGIDEGQFFDDIALFAEKQANIGKILIIAALDGNFRREGFNKILELVPLAESVVKLNAVCMKCYQIASFTKRLGPEKEIEIIGGQDKYMAVCRTCFWVSE